MSVAEIATTTLSFEQSASQALPVFESSLQDIPEALVQADKDEIAFETKDGHRFGSARKLFAHCFKSMYLTVDAVETKKYYLKTMIHNEFGQWRCLSVYFDNEGRIRKFSMLNGDTAFTQAALLCLKRLIGLPKSYFTIGFLPNYRDVESPEIEEGIIQYFASLPYGHSMESECSMLADSVGVPFYGLVFDTDEHAQRKIQCILGERDNKITLSCFLKKNGEIYAVSSSPSSSKSELTQYWQVALLGRKVLGRTIIDRPY